MTEKLRVSEISTSESASQFQGEALWDLVPHLMSHSAKSARSILEASSPFCGTSKHRSRSPPIKSTASMHRSTSSITTSAAVRPSLSVVSTAIILRFFFFFRQPCRWLPMSEVSLPLWWWNVFHSRSNSSVLVTSGALPHLFSHMSKASWLKKKQNQLSPVLVSWPTALLAVCFLQISCFSPLGAGPCMHNAWLPTLVLPSTPWKMAWQKACQSASTCRGSHLCPPAFDVSINVRITSSACGTLIRTFSDHRS